MDVKYKIEENKKQYISIIMVCVTRATSISQNQKMLIGTIKNKSLKGNVTVAVDDQVTT